MADKALYSLLVDLKANTAQLQADMDKAVGILQRSGRLMTNVVSGLAQGFGQAFGKELLGNIGKLSDALSNLADAGEEAGSIADSFQQLGGSSSAIEDARKATLGMVSSFDLMKVANEGMLRGIPELNKNFGMLADFAGRFANATGRDTVEVLQGITDAIGKGSEKALKDFGIAIQDTGSKSGNAAAAIEAFRAKLGEMGPVTDSVSNAHKAFTVALEDAWKQVGIGINENPKLTQAYRDLGTVVQSVDWHSVGTAIGEVTGVVVTLTSKVVEAITPITNFVNKLAEMIDLVKLGMLQTDRMVIKAQMAANSVPGLSQMASSVLPFDLPGADRQRTDQATRQADLEAQLKRVEDELANNFMSAFLKKADDWGKKNVPGFGTYAPSSGGGGAPAGPGAMFPVDPSSTGLLFDKRQNKWVTPHEFYSPLQVSNAKKTHQELADDLAKKELDALMKADRERSDQAGALMRTQYELQQQQAESSAKVWGDGLATVLSALGVDPQYVNAASQFGGNIVQSIIGGLTDSKDVFTSIGNFIAEGVSALFGGSSSGGAGSSVGGGGGSSWFGAAAQAASDWYSGNGMTTEQAHAAGIQGPGAADGSFNGQNSASLSSSANSYGTYAQAAMAAYQAWNSRDYGKELNGKQHQILDSIHGAGMVIANAWTLGLASYIEKIVGRENMEKLSIGKIIVKALFNEDAERYARHAFANWMEDRFKEMGGFAVRQKDGSFTRMTNFIEGDHDRFRDPHWGDEMAKQDKKVQATFTGLGRALKELLGITEDVGDQIGFLLGENLAFDIDNARHFVQRLGLSFDEVQKKLVEIGLKGEKTWLEIETGIQGASEAFKPGLAAVGDYNKAMENLIGSGARGFEAVQSIRDIFIEANEAGIKNMEELRQQLLKTYDPQIVDAFFAAARQRGVTTIEAGMKLDDRTAGGFVADMQAAGVKFKEVGDQMGNAMGSLNSATASNTSATQENTNAILSLGRHYVPENTDTTDDSTDTGSYASGGIVSRPTRALMGEAGPEAILPLTRKSGRLGVSLHGISGGGGYVVNIDARGAAPGVERRVRMAIQESEERISRSMYRVRRAG